MCLYAFLVVFLCVLLFFKQKTAYEMRISDWSSDVCSSDLIHALPKSVMTMAGELALSHQRTHGALLQHRLVILDQIQNFRFTGKEAAIYQPFIARPLLPEAEHAGAALFQPKGTIAAWLGHGRERAP